MTDGPAVCTINPTEEVMRHEGFLGRRRPRCQKGQVGIELEGIAIDDFAPDMLGKSQGQG
jgi:hypothetical protein